MIEYYVYSVFDVADSCDAVVVSALFLKGLLNMCWVIWWVVHFVVIVGYRQGRKLGYGSVRSLFRLIHESNILIQSPYVRLSIKNLLILTYPKHGSNGLVVVGFRYVLALKIKRCWRTVLSSTSQIANSGSWIEPKIANIKLRQA